MVDDAVTIRYRGEVMQVRRGTVAEAIARAGLRPESVLAVRDGAVVDDDTALEPGDDVRLVDLILGG